MNRYEELLYNIMVDLFIIKQKNLNKVTAHIIEDIMLADLVWKYFKSHGFDVKYDIYRYELEVGFKK